MGRNVNGGGEKGKSGSVGGGNKYRRLLHVTGSGEEKWGKYTGLRTYEACKRG